MKNVVGRPLDDLQPLIGEWSIEGRHVALPNVVVHGRSTFEWWGDRTFLIQKSTMDHPDFPDSIWFIGATSPEGGLQGHYFDTRAVHRVYDMTFGRGVWTLSRKAAGPKDFDQQMHATFSGDGNTITAESQLREQGDQAMRHDLAMTYRRKSPG
jgi:hypothetical protein